VISSDSNGVVVQLDGADVQIPVNATIEVHENDRVMVQFNDHEASIIGNVSDKSITRTTADGLIDVFAHNGTFSGALSAATGSFSGDVIIKKRLSFDTGYATLKFRSEPYCDIDGTLVNDYIGLVLENEFDDSSYTEAPYSIHQVAGDTMVGSGNYYHTAVNLLGNVMCQFRMTSYGVTLSSENTSLLVGDGGVEINGGPFASSGRIHANGGITLPNNKALRALDTNNEEKNLIYLNTADNVIINGNSSGTTYIVSDTSVSGAVSASGNIVSTGGYLSSNNCTSPTGGISGGYINANGRCALVGADSSNYPQVVFVTNKSTSRSTTLRSNNTAGTYTLTLPNSTGTLAVSSSDVRLKENIKPSEVSGLELIEKVKLHEFDWKPEAREGDPHWKIGMIADELEELDKNLTFGGGENEDGSMNVKGIDTTCMLAYLVKAVQELNERTKEAAA